MPKRWRQYALAAMLWMVGLGLIIALVLQQDSADLIEALAIAGWCLPLFFLSHAITILLDSLGWRATIVYAEPLSVLSLMVRRWVGMSVNALLPVAQLGGEVVRALLLRRLGPDGPTAVASVIVDFTVGMLTQIVFALIGLLLLATVLGLDASLARLGLGLAIFTLLIVTFVLLLRQGLIAGLAQRIGRFVKGPAWKQALDNTDQLDARIGALYRQRDRLLVCGIWRLLGWLWPSLEFWLLFWLLGHPVSIAEAVILEAIAQLVRSAGFGIPGGLGIQEGGVMLAATWLGLPTELALAAMLVRRVRELIYSLVGLVTWLLLESGKLQPGKATG